MVMPDGTLVRRETGTPQGSVVSPLLANLFLHYAFDRWMRTHHPDVPFERYADDAICHCRSEVHAHELRNALEARFAECKLELHPQKTKVVYCKDANRRADHPVQQFDFLGYTFRPRRAMNRNGRLFVSFAPAVSAEAAKAMRLRIRRWKLHLRTDLALEDLAEWSRPVLTGWIRYYGYFHRSTLRRALRSLDAILVRWARRKYRRLRTHKKRAWAWYRRIQLRQPRLFAHWLSEVSVGR